jgi:hypothetical protein
MKRGWENRQGCEILREAASGSVREKSLGDPSYSPWIKRNWYNEMMYNLYPQTYVRNRAKEGKKEIRYFQQTSSGLGVTSTKWLYGILAR